MSKKIIAVLCIAVLMVSVFAACGKVKGPTMKVKGEDTPLVTDAEGNTVLDSQGNILAYKLDSKGKLQKDENGEYVTQAISFPPKLFVNGTYETKDLIFTIPEGFEENDSRITGKTEYKSYLDVSMIKKLDEGETLKDYLDSLPSNDDIVDAMKEECDYAVCNEKEAKVNGNNAVTIEFIGKNGEQVKYYYIMLYFVQDGKVYKALYSAENGDSTDFDIVKTVEQNLKIK